MGYAHVFLPEHRKDYRYLGTFAKTNLSSASDKLMEQST